MKTWKVFLGIGITVLVIGIALLITGLALNDWKFGPDYEMETFTSSEEDSALDLNLSAGNMKVEFYDGDCVEITYPTAYNEGYTVTEASGKITVKPRDGIRIHWIWWRKIPDVTVKIPQGKVMDMQLEVSAGNVTVAEGEYGKLSVHLSAGNVTAGKVKCGDFKANLSAGTFKMDSIESPRAEIDLSAGTATLNRIACDDISVDLSAGSAYLTVLGAKADYNITVDKSAGSCNVSNQHNAQNSKSIDIDLSAGSVNVSFTD